MLRKLKKMMEFILKINSIKIDRNINKSELETSGQPDSLITISSQIGAALELDIENKDQPIGVVNVQPLLTEKTDGAEPFKTIPNQAELRFAALFKMVQTKDDPVLYYTLGRLYEIGEGTTANKNEAEVWFGKALSQIAIIKQRAQEGEACAQHVLNLMAIKGQCLPRHIAQTEKWLQWAAQQNDMEAQYRLGCMYMTGYGVQQDDTLAATWLGLAAAQGHVGAQFNLGCLYLAGRGVKQNNTEAVFLIKEAAKHNHVEAQYYYSWLLSTGGGGLTKNDKDALHWINQATHQRMVCTQ